MSLRVGLALITALAGAVLGFSCMRQEMAVIDRDFGTALTSCSSELPSCPADPPSWATTIEPVIKAHCAGCHGPGGNAETFPVDDYETVSARRSAVLDWVFRCDMPPRDDEPLSADDRRQLLTWLNCGAPNN